MQNFIIGNSKYSHQPQKHELKLVKCSLSIIKGMDLQDDEYFQKELQNSDHSHIQGDE